MKNALRSNQALLKGKAKTIAELAADIPVTLCFIGIKKPPDNFPYLLGKYKENLPFQLYSTHQMTWSPHPCMVLFSEY